eukprot:8236335-Pyramimonas_sp.AAC.2
MCYRAGDSAAGGGREGDRGDAPAEDRGPPEASRTGAGCLGHPHRHLRRRPGGGTSLLNTPRTDRLRVEQLRERPGRSATERRAL